MAFEIAQDPAADQVLDESPFALLAGMMLDQQYPMEHAFRGPAKVLDRFGTFEPAAIAAADPEEFKQLCSTPPAIHRFPGSMAARLQELARIVTDEYDGDAARIWTNAKDTDDLRRRIGALPGYGPMKVMALSSVLARRFGVKLAEPLAASHKTLGDVDSPQALDSYQAAKREHKAAWSRAKAPA